VEIKMRKKRFFLRLQKKKKKFLSMNKKKNIFLQFFSKNRKIKFNSKMNLFISKKKR
jgi:hypothetical protein